MTASLSGLTLEAREDRFPIAQPFTTARGSKTEAAVITVTMRDMIGYIGRGECVPYARYNESVASVLAEIDAIRPLLESGIPDITVLHSVMPAGAGRNALDCALWDLRAKQDNLPAWQMAGLPQPVPALVTGSTISLDTPEAMGTAAQDLRGTNQVKVKLGRADGLDMQRLRAVRKALPDARLLVDVNEGWSAADLGHFMPECAELLIACLEQPLPSGNDEALRSIGRLVPVIADESCHTSADLPALRGKYDGINIKLDKTGGFTGALELLRAAKAENFAIMIGCMVCSSLGIAPAALLASQADYLDLDGAALLAQDRTPAIEYREGLLYPPQAELWG